MCARAYRVLIVEKLTTNRPRAHKLHQKISNKSTNSIKLRNVHTSIIVVKLFMSKRAQTCNFTENKNSKNEKQSK